MTVTPVPDNAEYFIGRIAVAHRGVNMFDTIMGIALLIFLFVLGVMAGVNIGKPRFVEEHIDKPYCETTELFDKQYQRCWKAVEVTP